MDIISSLEKNDYNCTYTSQIREKKKSCDISDKWLLVFCPETTVEYIHEIYFKNDKPKSYSLHTELYVEIIQNDLNEDGCKKLMEDSERKRQMMFCLNYYSTECFIVFDEQKYSREYVLEIIKKAASDNCFSTEEEVL